MGKLSLLLVGAAILAGLTMSQSTRQVAGHTSRNQAETQADLLARQVAESGQSIVLARMMGADGLQDPGITTQAYDGGRFDVAVTLAPDRQTARVVVTGRYGGAAHRIDGEYAFDPITYPGPIWLDVPYATAQVVSGTPEIRGGAAGLPVRFDRRRHDDLGLESLLPAAGLVANGSAAAAAAGSAFNVPTTAQWTELLEDLNVDSGEDLYQVAASAFNPATDRLLAGPLTATGTITAPGPTTITRVTGNLTLDPGATLTGEGVLLVEGRLVLREGSTFRWTGLVIVRSTADSVPVHLLGSVMLRGGLVVVQDAYPPGGHIDVTTFQQTDGLTSPEGNQNGPWWAATGTPYPWYNHTHHWEAEVPEGQTIYFAERPGDRHEGRIFLRQALAPLGATPVYLEFHNPQNHGHARFTLRLAGEPTAFTGTVRNGFPEEIRAGEATHRSVEFAANRLDHLQLDVRSLRALRRSFDSEGGCATQWPLCIGADWDRRDALTVRVRRASDDARLYETSLYWHMRAEEDAVHEAEEAAWRAAVAAGVGFGSHLRLGAGARVHFDLSPISTLADRLGFDRNGLQLLQATTSHVAAGSAGAGG